MAEVDSLEITISASSEKAAEALDKLTGAMTRLKQALPKSNAKGFENLAKSLKSLGDTAREMEGSLASIQKAANAISQLANVSGIKIPKSVGDGLRNIAQAASEISPQAFGNLGELTSYLQRLSGANLGGIRIPKSVGDGIRNIANAAAEISPQTFANIDKLTSYLQRLSGIDFRGFSGAWQKASKATSAANTALASTAGKASTDKELLDDLTEWMKVNGKEGSRKTALGGLGGLLGKFKININMDDLKKVGQLAKQAWGHLKRLGQRVRLRIEAATIGKLKESLKGIESVLRSLGRIAFYRAIRSMIKAITQAFSEGLQNAYAFSAGLSNAIDGRIATALDNLSGASLKMKNQLGAAFGSLLTALAPIINALIGLITALATAITQLFAAFSGGTFLKAKDVSGKFADNMKAGGGAAKEWKNQLMGFDVINRLDDQNSGGGGGGSSGLNPEDMFEVVEIDQAIKDFVGALKKAVLNGDWQGVGELIGGKINELVDKINWAGIGKKLGYWFNGAIQSLYYTLKTIDFLKIGRKVAELINNALEQIDFTILGRLLIRKFTAGIDFFIGLITELNWGNVATAISDFIKGALDEASEWLASYDWENIATTIGTNIKDFLDKLDAAGIASSLSDFISNGLTALKDLLVSLDWAGIATKIKDTLVEFISGMDHEAISESFKGVMKAALDAAFAVVGVLFPDGLVPAIKDAIVGFIQGAVNLLSDDDFQAAHSVLSYKIERALFGKRFANWWWSKGDYSGKDIVMGLINGIETGGDVGAPVDSSILSPIDTKFTNFLPVIDADGNAIYRVVDGTFTDIETSASNMTSHVSGSFGEVSSAASTMATNGSNAFSSFGLTVRSWASAIITWCNQIAQAIATATGGGFSPFAGAAEQIHGFVPKAGGGFVGSGQLFLAREAGPELVGSIGGHTAVANNDQIVAAVSAGVFEAVSAAMGGGGGGQPVHIYLDGKEIARSTTKYQNQMARAGAY